MPVAELDVIKATWKVKHTTPNTISENVFYWRVLGLVDGNFPDVGIEIQNYLITLYTPIAGMLSTRYVLQDIRVTDETQKVFILDGVSGGYAGTDAAGEVLPAQDAAMVLARSRKLGHQGRKYIGPITEAAVEDGDLTAGNLALLQTFTDTWDSGFNGAITTNTYESGTAKFGVGGAVTEFNPFDTTLSKALPGIRTQRRRRPGVGLT